jgi:CBS domain-containing protein
MSFSVFSISCPRIRWMGGEWCVEALPGRAAGPRDRGWQPDLAKFWLAGLVLMNAWLLMAGCFILIGAQLEDQGVLFQSVVDTVNMQDIMLTEFSMLAPSDTLEDALHKSIHSLQDDFPVVRGDNLVGIISRQSILSALRSEGNGYVQAVMSRSFHVAQPEDSLGTTISRFAGRGLSLVPVTEGERIVGIVTLQNLMHSMSLLAESRKLRRQSQE